MKINRQKVFEKCGGRCAYCGEIITIKSFQVDHIHPKRLAHWQPNENIDRFENLNPSCRKCNSHKRGIPSINGFRREVSLQLERALKTSTQLQRALRYEQVKLTPKPIVFYFEKSEAENET